MAQGKQKDVNKCLKPRRADRLSIRVSGAFGRAKNPRREQEVTGRRRSFLDEEENIIVGMLLRFVHHCCALDLLHLKEAVAIFVGGLPSVYERDPWRILFT